MNILIVGEDLKTGDVARLEFRTGGIYIVRGDSTLKPGKEIVTEDIPLLWQRYVHQEIKRSLDQVQPFIDAATDGQRKLFGI